MKGLLPLHPFESLCVYLKTMQNYKAKIIALKRNLAVHVYGAGVLWYCDPVVCTVVTCTSTCTVTSNSCCDQFIYKLEKQDYMMFDFFFPSKYSGCSASQV